MKVAYYAGSFEIPHKGHIAQMKKIKEMGYYLVVAVNGNHFFLQNRGHAPFYSDEVRAGMIEDSGIPDDVIIIKNMEDQGAALKSILPDVIVLGMDWIDKPVWEQYCVPKEFFQELGIQVLYIPRAEGSSTEEKEKLLK